MKLLLVEDSARLRNVIEENLMEYSPFTIDNFATTQAEAINLLDTQQFDMMLVDIELKTLADRPGLTVSPMAMADAVLPTAYYRRLKLTSCETLWVLAPVRSRIDAAVRAFCR